ncbi:MAG: hypothetical protein ACXWZ4_16725 [Gemmatirosa sp.]
MSVTFRRARAAALLASVFALATVTACTGKNDGRRDAAGGSSNGAGPLPPEGPRAGQNTDTTMIPAATSAPAPGAAATPAATPAPAAAAPATKAP